MASRAWAARAWTARGAVDGAFDRSGHLALHVGRSRSSFNGRGEAARLNQAPLCGSRVGP